MPKMSRLCSKLTVIIIWSVLSIAAHAEAVATADEPKLRAAIVLGIIRYSHWPNDVDISGSLHVCSIGAPQSERILIQVSGQHKYHDVSIMITPYKNLQNSGNSCHALILGPDLNSKTLKDVLQSYNQHGLLTICDGCVINGNTAMVSLVRREKRIAFDVNLIQADQAGISFSSALLELALSVRAER